MACSWTAHPLSPSVVPEGFQAAHCEASFGVSELVSDVPLCSWESVQPVGLGGWATAVQPLYHMATGFYFLLLEKRKH